MTHSTSKYIISIFTVLLVILVITSDFHHNHPVSIQVHETCAVAVFQTAVTCGLLFFLILLLLTDLSPKLTPILFTIYIPRFLPRSKLSDRAPPQ